MNKKLYSLFAFIYLIIVYCATAQGSRNANGKYYEDESSVIKKRYQKNYKRGNKYLQRTDEDDTGSFYIKHLYKYVYYPYIQIIQNFVNAKVCIRCKCLPYYFISPFTSLLFII